MSLLRPNSAYRSPQRVSSRSCPLCARPLMRVRRSVAERELRDIASGQPLYRYGCAATTCGWQGLLPRRPRAAGPGEGAEAAAPEAPVPPGSPGPAVPPELPELPVVGRARPGRRLPTLPWAQLAGVAGAMALLVLVGVQGARLLQGGGSPGPVRTLGSGR